MIEGTGRIVAPAACDWLRNTTAARVLHIFARACNLLNEEGAILSLVTAQIGPGPFALVVTVPLPFTCCITPNTAVTLQNGRLVLGPLAIEVGSAEPWLPTPVWQSLQQQPARLAAWLPLLQQRTAAALESDWQRLADQQVTTALHALSQGLAQADEAACRAAAFKLAGLGSGLTPMGDDVLMGAIYALWASQPAATAQRLAKAVVETAVPRTTLLSAAWLRAAAQGEAAQPWHDLVTALSENDSPAIATAVRRILATGHTSGTAALAGFTAAVAAVYGMFGITD